MDIFFQWWFYLGISAVSLIIFFILTHNSPTLEECTQCGYPVKVGMLKKISQGEYLCESCLGEKNLKEDMVNAA
jgi:hypothetical protein